MIYEAITPSSGSSVVQVSPGCQSEYMICEYHVQVIGSGPGCQIRYGVLTFEAVTPHCMLSLTFLHHVLLGQQTCYTYISDIQTWSEALDRCSDRHMIANKTGNTAGTIIRSSLAVDNTWEKHAFLTRMVPAERTTKVWVAAQAAPYYWNWAPSTAGQLVL